MRRIYQIDGLSTGVLSVGEREASEQVALCIQKDEQETQILLSQQAFAELCELRYTVTFHAEPKPQELSEDSETHLQVV